MHTKWMNNILIFFLFQCVTRNGIKSIFGKMIGYYDDDDGYDNKNIHLRTRNNQPARILIDFGFFVECKDF